MDLSPCTPEERTEGIAPVQEHACFLHYVVEFASTVHGVSQEKISIGSFFSNATNCNDRSVVGPDWLPEDVIRSVSEGNLAEQVWQPTSVPVGKDLHTYVQRLLGRNDEQGAVGTRTFRLGQTARKLVQGKRVRYPRETPAAQRRPNQLVLEISMTAKQRLEDRTVPAVSQAIYVNIEDIVCVRFRTGLLVLVVETRFSPPTGDPPHPYLVVEGLYSLTRFNKLSWRRPSGEASGPDGGFRMGTLVRSLVGDEDTSKPSDRVFSASYLQFPQALDPAQREKLLFQIARHFNADYAPPKEGLAQAILQPFGNVSHCCTAEGCATIVEEKSEAAATPPEFLHNFLEAAYKPNYLNIILLAYHEYRYLLVLIDQAGFWPESKGATNMIDRLEDVRANAAKFVLCFRFSYISRMSLHNDVNLSIRQALGLDDMYSELERDTAHIDTLLRRMAEDRTERRFRGLGAIGALGVTWLTTFTITKEVLEVKAIQQAARICPDEAGLWAAVVSLVAAAPAAVYAWRKRSSD